MTEEKSVSVTEDDRKRFFELMNKNGLTWQEFWKDYDDDDVVMMLSHGG